MSSLVPQRESTNIDLYPVAGLLSQRQKPQRQLTAWLNKASMEDFNKLKDGLTSFFIKDVLEYQHQIHAQIQQRENRIAQVRAVRAERLATIQNIPGNLQASMRDQNFSEGAKKLGSMGATGVKYAAMGLGAIVILSLIHI